MKLGIVVLLLVVGALMTLPAAAYAQESTMTGTVTDSTGGVLPGVTVTATNVESGNTFVAVTDERGNFRLPVRVGNYRVTAELTGFTTVTRNLEMLVGQVVVVNVQMALLPARSVKLYLRTDGPGRNKLPGESPDGVEVFAKFTVPSALSTAVGSDQDT
jgi:hypothetical protein